MFLQLDYHDIHEEFDKILQLRDNALGMFYAAIQEDSDRNIFRPLFKDDDSGIESQGEAAMRQFQDGADVAFLTVQRCLMRAEALNGYLMAMDALIENGDFDAGLESIMAHAQRASAVSIAFKTHKELAHTIKSLKDEFYETIPDDIKKGEIETYDEALYLRYIDPDQKNVSSLSAGEGAGKKEERMEAVASALEAYSEVCIYDAYGVLDKAKRILKTLIAYRFHASENTTSENPMVRKMLEDLVSVHDAVNTKILDIRDVALSCADMAEKIRSNAPGFSFVQHEPCIKNPSFGL